MSVVVAIKYKDGVALAADKQITAGHIKRDGAIKIHKYPYSKLTLGMVGTLRDIDILFAEEELIDYKDIVLEAKINKSYVIKHVVPMIFAILKRNKRVVVENGMESLESSGVIATNSNLFLFYEDGAIIEKEDFAARGCGEELAQGFLTVKSHEVDFAKLNKEQVTQILQDSIVVACKDDAFVNDNIDFIYLEN